MATDQHACLLCGGLPGKLIWRGEGAAAARCQACGFVYLHERSDSAAALARETYERIYSKRQPIEDLTLASYAIVLKRFESFRAMGRIVDLGCGAGAFVVAAAEAGWEAIGTEVAVSAGGTPLPSRAQILVGEHATSALPDRAADVVTLWEVIEHVGEPIELLVEARRLLRPGGLLYLTTPNHGALTRRVLGSRWPRFHVEHTAYFDTLHLRQSLRQAGFAHARIYSKNLDPFILLGHFRSSRPSLPVGSELVEGVSRASPHQVGLRRFAKRTPVGRLVARSVNAVLAMTGLGDTLVAEAET